ncbi:MAG: hypothetical protein K1060chlam2_00329 [Chlamydiae bacterium]|nr:hypothetical protein [Chlamydiota bacterium]
MSNLVTPSNNGHRSSSVGGTPDWRSHMNSIVTSPYFNRSRSVGGAAPYILPIHKCITDLLVHDLLLIVVNSVAVIAIQQIFKKSSFSFQSGAIQAAVTTMTFLTCVELLHAKRGVELRSKGCNPWTAIRTHFFTMALTPFLGYCLQRVFIGRQIRILPLLFFTLCDSGALFLYTYR